MDHRKAVSIVLLCCSFSFPVIAQDPAPEEKKGSIPPNFSHYTLNPNPPATVLGWANERVEEKLNRGVLALRTGDNSVYIGWRLLKNDPEDTVFNVYRSTDGGAPVRLNSAPINKTTDFQDTKAPLDRENSWFVRAVVKGKEQEASLRTSLSSNSPVQQYRAFKIRDDIPAASIDKIGIGDLDGDGEYDFVVKRPGGTIDPSFTTRPSPDTFKIEAYKSDGTFMWRKDLGWSIQLGIWFSPFYVYDFDEVLNGSIAINNDGRLLWSTGNGHGDRFYVTDIDPDRPGLEIWYSYEDPHPRNGIGLWDAKTGDLIFGTDEEIADNQIARALVGDIDPAYPGMECWGDKFFFTSKGEKISGPVPPTDGLVWWDADLLREIHSRGRVYKWKGPVLTEGIEGRHMLWGDILGDWREEIVTFINGEVRLYSTIIPAADRRVTLIQDPLYRIDVGLIVQGYAHVPMTGFYLGTK